MTTPRTNLSDELKLIPWWAWLLAFACFAIIQWVMHAIVPHQPNPPNVAMRSFAGFLAGMVLAFYMLMVGYVNADARRRDMNVVLWTALVIFIPNAIGFIVYFLLRQPLGMNCPQCSTKVDPSYNFCPRCHYELHPSCPNCKRAAQAGDVFCGFCGTNLQASAPAR